MGNGLKPFKREWYLKLHDPMGQEALWLRFSFYRNEGGLEPIAEVWAIFFERGANGEMKKIACKESLNSRSFHDLPHDASEALRVGNCFCDSRGTRGSLQDEGKKIEWNLQISSHTAVSFDCVPPVLSSLGIVRHEVRTLAEDLRFSGTCTVLGRERNWQNAPGMRGYVAGPRLGHSWIWAHCNAFVDDEGREATFFVEGLRARARLGGMVAMPPLSAFLFYYQDQVHRVNTLSNMLRIQSEVSGPRWRFHVPCGELSFQGEVRAEWGDFVGITYRDTDGSPVYCANSKLSAMTIRVYRRDQLLDVFDAKGRAAFEMVSRTKNANVAFLL